MKEKFLAGVLAAVMAAASVPASAEGAAASGEKTVSVEYLASSKTVTIAGEEYPTDTTELWLDVSETEYDAKAGEYVLRNLTKTDLKNIGKLKKLKKLTLYRSSPGRRSGGEPETTPLKDIIFLKNCKKLETLILRGDCVEDLSALKDIPKLSSLTLDDMSLSKSQIKHIGKLKKLKNLYIQSCSADSYSALKNLTGLRVLDISSNSWEDISFLKNLSNLRELRLYGIEIKKFPSLSKLTKLKSMELSCEGSSLPALGNLPSLEKLWIEGTGIEGAASLTEISGLKNLTNLKELLIRDPSSLTNISALKNLTKLESLDLGGAASLSDISPLAGLTGLKDLRLECSAVSDLTPLRNLTNMESLSLYGSSVSWSDLSALSNMSKLRFFCLTGIILWTSTH